MVSGDSCGPLREELLIIFTDPPDEDDVDESFRIVISPEQVDAIELAARLGMSQLLNEEDGQPFYDFLCSILCMRNPTVSEETEDGDDDDDNELRTYFTVGDPEDVWTQLCALDKELLYDFMRARVRWLSEDYRDCVQSAY